MVEPLHSQIPIKPDQIIEIIIRRRWLIVIPLCITLTIGLFVALTAQKTYEATTTILVQPQRVPSSFVTSIVTSDINQRVSTISQQILSRSNLEKIIDQFGLYEESTGMYLEDQIAGMRKRVKVRIERVRHGAESFSVGFSGSDPQRVMRVANTLASYFMDENLKVREAQAVGTSEFLESELEKTRLRLEMREKNLSEYRAKHLGGLPDELESNLRTLDRLQTQLTDGHTALRETKNALSLFETQMSQSSEMMGGTDQFGFEDFGESSLSDDEQKRDMAQEQYDTLLLRYTDRHPDVAKLKRIIEKLEESIEETRNEEIDSAELAESDDASSAIDENAESGAITEAPGINFALMQGEMKIKQFNNEVESIQTRIKKIEQQMTIYQQRVENTPKREQELHGLQRDYGNIQKIFNSLLDRKLEAELSVNMEKKQKGEQFRILDHARLPEKPISPNVKMLFLLSLAAGFGIGGGAIFLLEIFDTSIRRDEQIENELGLNIIASIPPIKINVNKLKNTMAMSLFICCTIYAALFLSFFAILNYKGLDRTVNFIKTYINI